MLEINVRPIDYFFSAREGDMSRGKLFSATSCVLEEVLFVSLALFSIRFPLST